MNLILFSGGVESTALMTMAKPGDVALVIQLPYSMPSFRPDSVKKIASHFGVRLAYVSPELPDLGGGVFAHQMTTFVSVCSMFVARHPNITEVWCGRNSSEPSAGIARMIEDHMIAWARMHPATPFLHPLDHLSKREQWELIPRVVRPFISSCVYHSFCGTCPKCKEWLCLSESSPSATPA